MELLEQKAFITNNNMKNIAATYGGFVARIDEKIKSQIYKDDLSWVLSLDEFKYLYIELLVITESELLKKEARLARRNDGNFLFVNKSAPKYHLDHNCKYLNSSYENFSIPPQIEARGEAEKQRFRKFAEENKKVLYENQSQFLKMLEARFFLDSPPQKIEFDNSGVIEFSRLPIEEMEKVIDTHLTSARGFLSEHPHIKNLQYSPARVVNSPNSLHVTEEDKIWHDGYKRKLKSMLRAYIAKNNNPSFAYSESFLVSLGFEACSACAKPVELGF